MELPRLLHPRDHRHDLPAMRRTTMINILAELAIGWFGVLLLQKAWPYVKTWWIETLVDDNHKED